MVNPRIPLKKDQFNVRHSRMVDLLFLFQTSQGNIVTIKCQVVEVLYKTNLKKKSCAVNDDDEISDNHSTKTYVETVNKYYLEYSENISLDKKIVVDNTGSLNLTQFPLDAVHRVEVNPNLESCMFIASGGHSGIVQIHNVNKCLAFHAARDLRQELRVKS
ncbi:unnamed protein product [Mytilus coruscus]|uniref:Uncharacterized protein n=1 Tax=Mytilus coruscus TaxID=42192 RepID=A0A6J8BQ40_MYTCO|nr:unnamed protein product [Mytilus coruscus]